MGIAKLNPLLTTGFLISVGGTSIAVEKSLARTATTTPLAHPTTAPTGRPSTAAATRKVASTTQSVIPQAQCCTSRESLRSESIAHFVNCKKSRDAASCSDEANAVLAKYDLSGCQLPTNPDLARRTLWNGDAQLRATQSQLDKEELAARVRGQRSYSQWMEKILGAKSVTELTASTDEFIAAGGPLMPPLDLLVMSVARLHRETLRLDSQLPALRTEMRRVVSTGSRDIGGLGQLFQTKQLARDFYRDAAKKIAGGELRPLNFGEYSGIGHLELAIYRADPALVPDDLHGWGKSFGVDRSGGGRSSLSSLDSNNPFAAAAVASKALGGRRQGLASFEFESRRLDRPTTLQDLEQKIKAAEAARHAQVTQLESFWRDEVPGIWDRFQRDGQLHPDDDKKLSDTLALGPKSQSLSSLPTYCALRSLRERLQSPRAIDRALAIPKADQASRMLNRRPLTVVDHHRKLGEPTHQARRGDASCFGHAVSAVINSLPGGAQSVTPAQIYDTLSDGGFGVSADMAKQFKKMQEQTISDKKTVQIADAKVVFSRSPGEEAPESSVLVEMLKQGHTPIVNLETQARTRREDWINLQSSELGHAAVVVGHGNEINPFTGVNENYFLLRDSYGENPFPVKIGANEFLANVTHVGVINSVTVK